MLCLNPQKPLISQGLSLLSGWCRTVRWWTRQERIRTKFEVPFRVALLSPEELPLHQCIAEKALHLHQLGMSINKIANALGVDWYTVRKVLNGGKRKG